MQFVLDIGQIELKDKAKIKFQCSILLNEWPDIELEIELKTFRANSKNKIKFRPNSLENVKNMPYQWNKTSQS